MPRPAPSRRLRVENAEHTDPIEHTEPIDRIDPLDPIDRIDPIERIDPLKAMLSSEPSRHSQRRGYVAGCLHHAILT